MTASLLDLTLSALGLTDGKQPDDGHQRYDHVLPPVDRRRLASDFLRLMATSAPGVRRAMWRAKLTDNRQVLG